ncbi:hypothetical protein ABPG72_021431 [Tetrahymena utriculariae]
MLYMLRICNQMLKIDNSFKKWILERKQQNRFNCLLQPQSCLNLAKLNLLNQNNIIQKGIKVLFVIIVILMESYGEKDIRRYLSLENVIVAKKIFHQWQQCWMNTLILFQIYMTFKLKPYKIKNFNILLQKSSILSALSLNLTSIISHQSNGNAFLGIILMLLLIFPNLKFILQLVIGMYLITISSDSNKRNKFHQFLFYLKQKMPSFFENIQIQNKIICLLKFKKVKSKIRIQEMKINLKLKKLILSKA